MAGSCYVVAYDGWFGFGAPPATVWSSIAAVDQFERWWGWLGDLRVDGAGLSAGAVLHGTVSPPLPYRMRVDVTLERCVDPRLIDATVHGDLEGDAHLRLAPDEQGTQAHVTWTIEMMQRPMRAAARVGYPVLRWGHDRVVDATVWGFRRHLGTVTR